MTPADPIFAQAVSHHQAGRLTDAEAGYRQALARDPNHADALHMLGLIAQQAGNLPAAEGLLRRAIALQPNNAAFRGNLGMVCQLMGRIDQTIDNFRAAAALRSDIPEAHYNLAMALERAGRWGEAAEAYHAALSRRAEFPEALANLGRALIQTGDIPQALQVLRRAAKIAPTNSQVHFDLGVALMEANQPADAVAAYRMALAIRPDYAQAAWNLTFALLASGNLREGWRAYEIRHRLNLGLDPHPGGRPIWDRSPLQGRTILLYPEKGYGFGEVIQMSRFAPLVAATGGRVILECQPELQELLKALAGASELVSEGQPLPPHDLRCPLLSLPHRFDVSLETIPSNVPYLHAEAAKVEQWQNWILQFSSGEPQRRLNVGLVWTGRPFPPGRSIDPALLLPLANVPGVRFFSVQKPEPSTPAQSPFAGLIDCGEKLTDFSETAALLCSLDLVITIDTAVAHLAGALGRPTWLLLRHAADWRWLTHRPDSPWYPTLRLFRQPAPGDWATPIGEVTAALARREEISC